MRTVLSKLSRSSIRWKDLTTMCVRLAAVIIIMVAVFATAYQATAIDEPSVSFTRKEYRVTKLQSETVQVEIAVRLSKPAEGDIKVRFETQDDTAKANVDYQTATGELTFKAGDQERSFYVVILKDHEPSTGEKTALLNLSEPDGVELGTPQAAKLKIIPPQIYLPAIVRPQEWQPFDKGDVLLNLRSLGICPDDSEPQFAGTIDGLFHWSEGEWKKDSQTIKNVRDFAFGADKDCKSVFGASLDSGVWQRTNNGTEQWVLLGKTGAMKDVRAVELRGQRLFAGSDKGVQVTEDWTIADKTDWQLTGTPGLITSLSQAGDRLFGTIWAVGAQHTTGCTLDSCKWSDPQAPVGDALVLDSLGEPEDDNNPWLLATSSEIYFWQGNATDGAWKPKESAQPQGHVVYSLATFRDQTVGIDLAFAGVEEDGVWVSYDNGRNWQELGRLGDEHGLWTVIDLAVTNDGMLFAATPENGVWQWQLPAPPTE